MHRLQAAFLGKASEYWQWPSAAASRFERLTN